jgi:hypothetical protein
MQIFGRTSVSEFVQDRIVFRSLVPVDPSLPPLAEYWKQAGQPEQPLPRKHEPAYAGYVAWLLRHARRQSAPRSPLRRVLFIGDTRLGDGTAFDHICQAGGWNGLIFIGADRDAPAAISLEASPSGGELFLANRWTALLDFEAYLAKKSFPIDEATALLVDVDKTAIGARGRNDHVIDRARVQAVQDTVKGLLGECFNEPAFLEAYRSLNRADYHPFTQDNQDYLAYICLVLGSGYSSLGELLAEIQNRETYTFTDFIGRVEDRKAQLPPALLPIHTEIFELVQSGDPTPFKAFRRNEYLSTSARMGCMPGNSPVGDLLKQEIVITEEVRRQALKWQALGALVFGLSDKPDEAAIPTSEQANQGALPLHRIQTHSIGMLAY